MNQLKGAIRKDPEDIDVQITSRSSSPSELLFGPLQCALVMVWLGLYRFMDKESAVIAAAVGVGDGLLAPIIGKLYGRHRYQMPLSGSKTMEGTVVGVFLGTVSGCYMYLSLMSIPLLPLRGKSFDCKFLSTTRLLLSGPCTIRRLTRLALHFLVVEQLY